MVMQGALCEIRDNWRDHSVMREIGDVIGETAA
jgi:hypothetical protein